MKTIITNQARWMTAVGIALLMSAMPSYARMPSEHERNNHHEQSEQNIKTHKYESGGEVLPARVGLLSDLAAATADYNTYGRWVGDPIPAIVSSNQIRGLYVPPGDTTFTLDISRGSMLYVPVFFSDDSYPAIGNFPQVGNQKALKYYYHSHNELGAVDINITVDGKKMPLNDDYLVNVNTPAPLRDAFTGYPGGTQYLTVAALLSPLKIGQHTITVGGRLMGQGVKKWCAEVLVLVGYVCPDPYQDLTLTYTVNVH